MGKKSSKSKTTNEPPKWARPHLEGAANMISGVVGQNQGNLQNIASGISSQLPGLADKAFGENPMLGAANQFAMDTIGGKYLDEGNPYLQGMIDQTGDSVMNRVNNLAARSGASLGTQHFGIAAKELANSENNLRYQNYGNERNAQTQAAGMVPSLNNSQYAGIMPYLAAAQTAGGLPYQGIQNLGQIGGLLGGFGTQTQQQPGGWGQAALGAFASAAPFIFSDRRLKKNIEKVGDYPNGLGKYRWVYRFDPSETVMEGVMADEVKERFPNAYREDARGYGMVNYALLEAA